MLPGGFVRDFGEFADQFFKDQSHLAVADVFRMQIDLGELLGDQIKQSGLGEAVDLGVEFEALEDVAHGRREGLDIAVEVLADVVLVAHELLHVKGRGVVEALLGFAQQERLGFEVLLLFGGKFGEDCGLGGFEHAVESAQDSERAG